MAGKPLQQMTNQEIAATFNDHQIPALEKKIANLREWLLTARWQIVHDDLPDEQIVELKAWEEDLRKQSGEIT